MAATHPWAGGLRVAYRRHPEFAAQALDAILKAGYSVQLIAPPSPTAPPAAAKLSPRRAVKQLARSPTASEVDQPEKLRTDERATASPPARPMLVVAATRPRCRPGARAAAPGLHQHPRSLLLPRFGAGAAPIHHAIGAGDAETGITIMQMDGASTTPARCCGARCRSPRTTPPPACDRLAALGGECIIVEALGTAVAGGLVATPQPAGGRDLRSQRSDAPGPTSTGAGRRRRSSAPCAPSTRSRRRVRCATPRSSAGRGAGRRGRGRPAGCSRSMRTASSWPADATRCVVRCYSARAATPARRGIPARVSRSRGRSASHPWRIAQPGRVALKAVVRRPWLH